MPRIQPIIFDELSAEQQRLYKEIGGTRTGVGGPFTVWMQTPELADIFNKVGDILRTRGKLEKRLQELMILLLSRAWNCQYQWAVHEADALANGLEPSAVEAIRAGRRPELQRDDERIVFAVVTELISAKALSEATYQRALELLGMEVLIQLVTNCGRYTQAAMVVNAFEVAAPDGARPLPDIAAVDFLR